MKARRDALKGVLHEPGSTHAGLWLDKYLEEQEVKGETTGSGGNPRTRHYQIGVELGVPAFYQAYYERWTRTLKAFGAKMRTARVKTRMVVGLGAESVLETSITLHRTCGVPFIPGSALKGLAASYARKYLGWGTKSEEYTTLFGDTDSAGYVTFFDAMYVPGTAPHDRPLALDVMTVHHPEYYQGKDAPPADWDNPNPVSFVTAQGEYLLALAGPQDWVDVAFYLLKMALAHEGVGAKTAIGYGRLVLSDPPPEPYEQEVQQIQQLLGVMRDHEVSGQIRQVYERWRALEAPEDIRREVARMILERIHRAGQKSLRKKDWYRELQKFVSESPAESS